MYTFMFTHTHTYIYIYIYMCVCAQWYNGLSVRKCPGIPTFNPGQVIPKIQKMVLDASLLYTQHNKVPIKGKWGNPEKAVASFTTSRCSSY